MKQATVHFITGGQRSGKSEFAEQQALSLSKQPVYLATSKIWDDEYSKRIDIHRARRSDQWTTIEETTNISQLDLTGKVVLLDCITLWLTNIFDDHSFDPQQSLDFAKIQWNQLIEQDMTLIVVGNEIGLGVISMDKGTRQFVDTHGTLNQLIAQQADHVTLMISGLPLQVK